MSHILYFLECQLYLIDERVILRNGQGYNRKSRGIIPNVSVFEEGKDLGVIPREKEIQVEF